MLIPATFQNSFALQSPSFPEYHLRAFPKISHLKEGMFLTLSIITELQNGLGWKGP